MHVSIDSIIAFTIVTCSYMGVLNSVEVSSLF